jgi:hypothetical protein
MLFALVFSFAAGSGAAWAGDWRASPSCGPRTYERRFLFMPDRTFLAEDRLAPCPPRSICLWYGFIWKGRYVLTEDGIVLTVTHRPPAAERYVPLPAQLLRDPRTGALRERAPDGSLCPYVS